MALVDTLHQHGIGVILDWVPSHFPNDAHGLARFDGTALYEHEDLRQGFHPEWNSLIFNYGRNEVRAFLLSSARHWLLRYHFDGLRVDAVASMLYLDYARKEGEWVPNRHGGRENLEAIDFLRKLNELIYQEFPDVQMIAEESTAWPMVSRPTWLGGLGFGMKWNMGWMHDTLNYVREDPIHRKYHHDRLTFSLVYAFNENFVLPLSHDEVVHGKGSLIGKQPGDTWRQFAGLRLMFGYMWAHPGKKLLFMGGEFGQRREWTHEGELEWGVLQHAEHAGLLQLGARPQPHVPRAARAVGGRFRAGGFSVDRCVGPRSQRVLFRAPRPRRRPGARGVQLHAGAAHELRARRATRRRTGAKSPNSDAQTYGGSGVGNFGGVASNPAPAHGQMHSVTLTLPPLAALWLACESPA